MTMIKINLDECILPIKELVKRLEDEVYYSIEGYLDGDSRSIIIKFHEIEEI